MEADSIIIDSRTIDYSRLVGREIKIRTEQFPGQLLSTRILAISENNMVLDRSGSCGRIDQLIGNQKIEVIFDYKGEPVAFTSRVLIPRPGRLCIPITGQVSPQVRRQFVRFEVAKDVRLTFFNESTIGSASLSRLKWLATSTANISGGGTLIKLSQSPLVDDFTVLHLALDEFALPRLLVGRIRHRQHGNDNQLHIGIEFIIRENCFEKLPRNLLKSLPLKLFSFDEKTRMELADYLANNYRSISEMQGVI
jgi:hypothetical protein